MTNLKTITSQIISFTSLSTLCISVNQLAQIHNFDYTEYTPNKPEQDNQWEIPARISIGNLEKDNKNHHKLLEVRHSSKDINDSLVQKEQKKYILLTNKLRTLIALKKENEVIDLIEKSTLVNFVDAESLELIKEAIKASAE